MRALRPLTLALCALLAAPAAAEDLRGRLTKVIDITGTHVEPRRKLCGLVARGGLAATMRGDWTLRAGRATELAATGPVRHPPAGTRRVRLDPASGDLRLSGELGTAALRPHAGPGWPFGSRGPQAVAGGEVLATTANVLPGGCGPMPRLRADGHGADGRWTMYLYLRSPDEAVGAIVTEAPATGAPVVRLVDLKRAS
ncbi:hypothetical protein JQC91_11175 [Jannaschia sp. Os4]|uniref:hypothetical protein n=1 Tax=Jannaschia sp. Os4 TaxID=2807617 RepID=UPI00193A5072|nr:hypothetical protein [Jannaschia sp. Os4]MBM2576862.1 hypothetical protein [Jannaschia sp. Os4]